MDVDEFRKFGAQAIEFMANYLETIRERPVLPSVEPGYLHDLLPTSAPEEPEHWKNVLDDMTTCILPGITNWQSPNFHAYYPSATSYPSMIGEMLSAGFGLVGFSWMSAPACTELEVIMMNWLGKIFDLPKEFLNCEEGPGGGVIQGSASEAILVAVLAAREQTVRRVMSENPNLTESDVRGRLICYSSDQSNSCVEKAGMLAAVPMKLLPADENCSIRGYILQKALETDLADGKIPIIFIGTLGTTGTCAYDNLGELSPICKANNIWLHVDAAYAGAALCCPELRHYMPGIDGCDSLNINLHKWMMVNFDCCAMWMKDANLIVQAFTVDRIYLSHQYEGQAAKAPDYRHWQIPLGRRFRALKVWIVLRTIGIEAIRTHIRNHIKLAKIFEMHVKSDDRFEVVTATTMGLVCFRLKGDCQLTKTLIDKITERKLIYMIQAKYQSKLMIRFAVCGLKAIETDMDFAWNEIQMQANEVFVTNGFKQTLDDSTTLMDTDVEDGGKILQTKFLKDIHYINDTVQSSIIEKSK